MRFIVRSVQIPVIFVTTPCRVECEVERDGQLHDVAIFEESTGRRRSDLETMRSTREIAEAALRDAAHAKGYLK